MRVSVRLHAVLRDLLPEGRGEVELDQPATITDLLNDLGVDEEFRELVTVNGEQVEDLGAALSEGDEVQVFPAVAGGGEEMNLAYLDEARRLFAEGDHFNAHEVLEEHWLEVDEEERDFLQGLIHLSVGLHHLGRENFNGAEAQFRKAQRRLERYPQQHHGVDLAAIRGYLQAALLGDPPDEAPQI